MPRFWVILNTHQDRHPGLQGGISSETQHTEKTGESQA
jgi:hypothetical protein